MFVQPWPIGHKAIVSIVTNSIIQLWHMNSSNVVIHLRPSFFRAETFLLFFDMIIKEPLFRSNFSAAFSFLLDVSDGHSHCQIIPGLPVLVLSKNSDEKYSLPIPDLYQVSRLKELSNA